LLNDIVSRVRSRLWLLKGGICADVYSGTAMCILPAEPATSVDIALGLLAFTAAWRRQIRGGWFQYYRALCCTARVLVICYAKFISGRLHMTQDEEKGSSASSQFLIKETKRLGSRVSKLIYADTLLMKPGVYCYRWKGKESRQTT
jgi:hypothetical protein